MTVANHDCICKQPLQKYANTGEEVHQYNCPQDRALGLLCHKHFEMRNAKKWEAEECDDCQNARKKRAEEIQQKETIDPTQPYGQHIALTCKNHRDLRWSTKNIGWIGARSIFYFSETKPECSCPSSDLIIVKAEEGQGKNVLHR